MQRPVCKHSAPEPSAFRAPGPLTPDPCSTEGEPAEFGTAVGNQTLPFISSFVAVTIRGEEQARE